MGAPEGHARAELDGRAMRLPAADPTAHVVRVPCRHNACARPSTGSSRSGRRYVMFNQLRAFAEATRSSLWFWPILMTLLGFFLAQATILLDPSAWIERQ